MRLKNIIGKGRKGANLTPSGKKSKGKKFETKIADSLHNYLMDNIPEYKNLYEQFNDPKLAPRRDASSGADLLSDADINLGIAKNFFPFAMECKDWKTLDLPLNAMMSDKIKILTTVWNDQAVPKCDGTDLTPLVVFKALRTKDYCFYDSTVIQLIPEDRFIKMGKYIICLWEDFMRMAIC